MSNPETLKQITSIHRRAGEPVFRMALTHLFDCGWRNFTEEEATEAKKTIQDTTKPNSFMTAQFQCDLVDLALELSRYSIWELLFYVKLYLGMEGDDFELRRQAESTLRGWARYEDVPSAWSAVIEDEDLLRSAVTELLEQHDESSYTREEIESALQSALEE